MRLLGINLFSIPLFPLLDVYMRYYNNDLLNLDLP
jgi:hypothetical protein